MIVETYLLSFRIQVIMVLWRDYIGYIDTIYPFLFDSHYWISNPEIYFQSKAKARGGSSK
jgi:hypothetical protein